MATAGVLESASSHIGILAELCADGFCRISKSNLAKLRQLFDCTPTKDSQGDETNETVFNYHLGAVLDDLLRISCLLSEDA